MKQKNAGYWQPLWRAAGLQNIITGEIVPVLLKTAGDFIAQVAAHRPHGDMQLDQVMLAKLLNQSIKKGKVVTEHAGWRRVALSEEIMLAVSAHSQYTKVRLPCAA